MKSVQIRNFFWSVFSCTQSEYRKTQTRKNSVFGHFSPTQESWAEVFRGYWKRLYFMFSWKYFNIFRVKFKSAWGNINYSSLRNHPNYISQKFLNVTLLVLNNYIPVATIVIWRVYIWLGSIICSNKTT